MMMNALPEGTLTFLFTDIEGSTRLWERHSVAMQSALAVHDRLMRREIEVAGGSVFKTVGDSFCAVFPVAISAVRAAVSAQLALQDVQWPDDVMLKVRMALHTGNAELRDHDYFGTTLNRAARILAAAHGGQVILSEAAHALSAGAHIAGISFLSLGYNRLKDLERPEHIFQLCHSDLPSDFPPLRALSQNTHNLPVQLTSFVGRENEKQALIEMLGSSRLVTLAGSGGCGKTRLAEQTAVELLDVFPQGVWLVELAPVTDPEQVPRALADVLGVREEVGTVLTNTLCNALKSRKTLLLLDNCEHLLTAASQLTDALMNYCPDVHVLATSREALGVPGEHVYRIPSLSTPPTGGATDLQIGRYESVQLFVERARMHQPAFALTPGNAASVSAVCARLDGIPLAIELAAARARAMSVNEIEKRLDQRFRLLTGGSRTVLPRQQTLRQLIDWSYDLLNDCERTMLQRVSVFMGGWSLECAEQVCSCGDIEEWKVIDLLTSLLDKSLIVVDSVADAELGDITRYKLLETVRQYSLERLTEAGGAMEARYRHRDWFVGYAEKAEQYLEGNGQVVWLKRLALEHENLENALNWCWEEGEMGQSTGTETGLKMAAALGRYWSIRGHFRTSLTVLDELLGQSLDGVSRKTLAQAHASVGLMNYSLSNYSVAQHHFEIALTIHRELGELHAEADCLSSLAVIAFYTGNYTDSETYVEQAFQIFRTLNDRLGEANCLAVYGIVAMNTADYSKAREFQIQSWAISQEIGDRQLEASNLLNLGIIAFYSGDYSSSHQYFEPALAISREIGDPLSESICIDYLGLLVSNTVGYLVAREYFEKALDINREIGNRQFELINLLNLGDVAGESGDNEVANKYYGISLVISRELGDRWHEAEALLAQGYLAIRATQFSEASELLRLALSLSLEISQKLTVIASLEAFGSLLRSTSRFEIGCQVLGAAHSAREALQAPLPPLKVAGVERDREACRSALGDAEYERCWAAGAALTLEEAAALALPS